MGGRSGSGKSSGLAAALRAVGVGSPEGFIRSWGGVFGKPLGNAADVAALLGVSSDTLARGSLDASTGYGRLSLNFAGPGVSMSRTFHADGTVRHGTMFVAEHLQGSGFGTRILRQQVAQYQRLGIKEIRLDATEVGRYAWPKLGFKADAADLKRYNAGFKSYAKANGLSAPRTATTVQQIAKSPHGKAYLLSDHAPNRVGLTARVSDLARTLK